MSAREAAVAEVARRLAVLAGNGNLRVAVDGRTASGKTRFADELANAFAIHERSAIRASIDGFHRPRAERYRRGRMSPDGYYRDARDHDAIVALLLRPLAPGGDRRIRTESFDLAENEPISAPAREVESDAILIVDGTFLQRPELAAHWDAVIFVRTDPAICLERGVRRDALSLGGEERARLSYAQRYQPAYEIYETEANPERDADVVVGNDCPETPQLSFRSGGRLGAKGSA